MLRVLIADDEPYVREGIKQIVPWKECGYEICGEGIDGDDAFEKIKILKPDLVLIDIRMPGKLGLDVIRESVENGFKGRFVIVSGYSDFKYAKEAIKYGVKSYVLKPIDEEELMEIVCKLRDEIIEENKKLNKLEKQKGFVREYALAQFILGKEIDNYDDLINSFNYSEYRVALVTSHEKNTKNENIIELENCIKKRVANIKGVEVCKVKNKVGILFCDNSKNHCLNILNSIKDEVKKSMKHLVFITVGPQVQIFDNVINSYIEANSLMKKKFLFLIESDILTGDRIDELKEKDFLYDEFEILDRIHNYVEIGEVNRIKQLGNNLKEIIQSKLYTEEQFKVFITKICLDFNEKIKHDYEIGKDSMVDNEKVIEEIYNKESLVEIITYLMKRYTHISKTIAVNTSDKSIKRIVKYIDKNYYTDLKLELLAEIFNYNSAYLGKVFKSHTGVSFNTYLDTIRIEHAKKLLLEEGIKVYQVCEKVGYKNIDYFHSKFKKYVGVSPLNFKKQQEDKVLIKK